MSSGNGDPKLRHPNRCVEFPPAGPLPAGCNGYDFDGDGVVALKDFATVQAMFPGL